MPPARLLPQVVALEFDAPPRFTPEAIRQRLDAVEELLERAALVVTNDSGPMHLAAALGKPGVAIFGPTDPARNGPYGGSTRVLRSPSAATTYKRSEEIDPSMYEISADEVFESLRDALSGAAGSRP